MKNGKKWKKAEKIPLKGRTWDFGVCQLKNFDSRPTASVESHVWLVENCQNPRFFCETRKFRRVMTFHISGGSRVRAGILVKACHLIGWTRRKARQALAFSQKQHFLRMAVSLINGKYQNARTKCSLNRVGKCSRPIRLRPSASGLTLKHWV